MFFFMKTIVKNILGIEHYQGSIEFVPGRGEIHLRTIAFGKDKAYLEDFYKATTKKIKPG